MNTKVLLIIIIQIFFYNGFVKAQRFDRSPYEILLRATGQGETAIISLINRYFFWGNFNISIYPEEKYMTEFEKLFIPNAKIVNLASPYKEMINYLDYGQVIIDNLANGLNLKKDPKFQYSVEAVKNKLGYLYNSFVIKVYVYNGYDEKFKEVKYEEGKVFYLNLVIQYLEESEKAKFIKIYNIPNPLNSKRK